jgi:hypothetical protein
LSLQIRFEATPGGDFQNPSALTDITIDDIAFGDCDASSGNNTLNMHVYWAIQITIYTPPVEDFDKVFHRRSVNLK